MPGERNPQSVAEEFAPPPQGENVFDAAMMAELIVTKKEIGPQLKESTRNLAGQAEMARRGWSTIAVGGKTGGRVPWILSFRGSGALLAAGFAASVRTLVEEKIGADTAAWTRVTQGHSQDPRHGKRQRSCCAGFDMACVAEQCNLGDLGDRWGRVAKLAPGAYCGSCITPSMLDGLTLSNFQPSSETPWRVTAVLPLRW